MKETIFKILIHKGEYVDEGLLDKGIYSTSTPRLYSKDTTIEHLVECSKLPRDFNGNQFVSEDYLSNLNTCEMIKVTLFFDA